MSVKLPSNIGDNDWRPIFSSHTTTETVVRDSSPSNGFYGFAVTVGRQSAMHTENSGFASPTLGQHISTFRGYRILFLSETLI